MKHKLAYLLLIATLFFASCAKESTYTITNDTGMDGTVFVHECNEEGETITAHSKKAVFRHICCKS